jgi:GNAT superfamily N-acetyltransferase
VINYRVEPPIDNAAFNGLFVVAWPDHGWTDFESQLVYCFTYICAYDGEHLIGFAKVAWDGGTHGFLLDPVVHPEYRHRGIATHLVAEIVAVAKSQGLHWLHVDYEPGLRPFYESCGFRPTDAGLIRLDGHE